VIGRLGWKVRGTALCQLSSITNLENTPIAYAAMMSSSWFEGFTAFTKLSILAVAELLWLEKGRKEEKFAY
jgi:hypothetical protein